MPERRPRCKRLHAAPGSPQPPRPDVGLHSSLVVVAEEGGLRCRAGDPHEADPLKPPREADPANDPREAGTPPLVMATVVPLSPTSCSASAIAPVVVLGASADMSISNGPELLTFIGVVGVEVVVHKVPSALR